MTSSEIRSEFLSFFESRGHRIVPSAPVIPGDDPTLLFTNAGMNQFKDVFLGTGQREYVRAADSQKCIRVSGKHNDLEEVGRDTYHHTFFEMLGNWSFGDYYKKEAIGWAWELLTRRWGLGKARLYATVFESDDEAAEIWKSATDIDPSHILRFGKKDNFWEMGETGPCGPCSEIHIDLTADLSGAALVNAGDPRVMEIWNLVFIQYNRDNRSNLTPLPAKHVDTGMGFERICAVLQGKSSNYDTDVFMPIIGRIAQLAGRPYGGALEDQSDVAMRVIADHVRMLSFSVADGGMPSNEGRGYVMRRILRRAARFGRALGFREPFIYSAVTAVADSMGDQYPEIRERQSHIERVIRGEEESFNATLDRGIEIFESVIEGMGHSKTFPGEDAFKLYDTYGFPLDLTELMAAEKGMRVDTGMFAELMEEQRSRARSARQADAPVHAELFDTAKKSTFLGYTCDEHVSRVIDIRRLDVVDEVILQETPFYVESGGQVSDRGTLELPDLGVASRVSKVFRTPGGAVVHVVGTLESLQIGSKVNAAIDRDLRRNVERNHTATHLVHEALRRILGSHAHQQGSLVAPDHLRFDFNHFERITPERLKAIEDIVNAKITESIDVFALNDPKEWLTIEEAKKKYPNVKMFFGDKYGDRVRIVEVDPAFSVELCGGTHVKNTREIGFFKIIAESSVASGIRRIEAVTGEGLRRYIEERVRKIGEMDDQLHKLLEEAEVLERQAGAPAGSMPQREVVIIPSSQSDALRAVETLERRRREAIEEAAGRVAEARKKQSRNRIQEASAGIDSIVAAGTKVNGSLVVAARVDVGTADELKSLGDTLRSKIQSGVGVLGAVIDDKVSLVCVVTDDLIAGKKLMAGKIVGELAKRVGGGGGGRPHLATAGGRDVSKLDAALAGTSALVASMLGS